MEKPTKQQRRKIYENVLNLLAKRNEFFVCILINRSTKFKYEINETTFPEIYLFSHNNTRVFLTEIDEKTRLAVSEDVVYKTKEFIIELCIEMTKTK